MSAGTGGHARRAALALAAVAVVTGGVLVVASGGDGGDGAGPLERVGESDRLLPGDRGGDGARSAGHGLSHGSCEGEGVPAPLGTLPMAFEDFALVVPYGLMVGNHVTPIDHQYFSPTVFDSPRDAYPVRAMGDALLVEIGRRTTERGDEYRLVFSVTCTFFYYYDLVTSLAPELQRAFDETDGTPSQRRVKVAIEEGQVVGRIGGQTLDFAVWDTTRALDGLLEVATYEGERWKPYTADPLDYYTPELADQVRSKYLRTVEPRSGRIDYDVDGRLAGNWFVEGSGGYAGDRSSPAGYWSTHLAFAPNHLDPSVFVISIGQFAGAPRQFTTTSNAPFPEDVGVSGVPVRYDLVEWEYVLEDGSRWDRRTPARGLRVEPHTEIKGCALARMVAARRLRFEAFPGTTCPGVGGFTDGARYYER